MHTELETAQEIQGQIFKELVRAARDRHHAWRTPVLATVGLDGTPNARTVVLRNVRLGESAHGTRVANINTSLEIYTDGRSHKVHELQHQPHASLAFWSPRLNWQLRIKVHCSVQTEGPYVESLWQTVKQSRAAADYLGLLAPGDPLPTQDAAAQATPSQTDDLATHFALLTAQIIEIDWLELGRGHHRRARLGASDDRADLAWDWQWCQP